MLLPLPAPPVGCAGALAAVPASNRAHVPVLPLRLVPVALLLWHLVPVTLGLCAVLFPVLAPSWLRVLPRRLVPVALLSGLCALLFPGHPRIWLRVLPRRLVPVALLSGL